MCVSATLNAKSGPDAPSCRGTRIRFERRVILLRATPRGAEIHPVGGLLWSTLDERLGHRNGLGEALGELQAGVEHHARLEIAGRPREHRTGLGFGLCVFALGQQLTGSFDGCGGRSGSVHVATPYEEKGRVANTTRPFGGQSTSRSDQNLYVAEMAYLRPNVSYVFTSVFALVTLFWYSIGGCSSDRFVPVSDTLMLSLNWYPK